MTNEIKLGDFIKGTYQKNNVYGIVTEIKKDLVVIKRYIESDFNFETKCYSNYRVAIGYGEFLNVRKNKIIKIGLNENENIIA